MSDSDLERSLVTQCGYVKLPAPIQEHVFMPGRRWAFDLAWPDRMVAVEVEGGQWKQGRHQRGKGMENDCIKYSEAALAGWLLIRCTGDMVDDGRAIALVERALAVRG